MNSRCGTCQKPNDNTSKFSVDGDYHQSCLELCEDALAKSEQEAGRVLLIHYAILTNHFKERHSSLLSNIQARSDF